MPNVRTLRLTHGLTLTELALLIEIPARTLAEIEYGLRPLTTPLRNALADFYGLPPALLQAQLDAPRDKPPVALVPVCRATLALGICVTSALAGIGAGAGEPPAKEAVAVSLAGVRSAPAPTRAPQARTNERQFVPRPALKRDITKAGAQVRPATAQPTNSATAPAGQATRPAAAPVLPAATSTPAPTAQAAPSTAAPVAAVAASEATIALAPVPQAEVALPTATLPASEQVAGASIAAIELQRAPQSEVALPTGAPPPPPTATSAPAAVAGEDVVAFARQFVGAPYAYGGADPNGFDCSGFTQYVYRHFGIELPRVAADQYNAPVGDSFTDVSRLQPGDLVFFANTYGPGITHVGIFVGNGDVVQAMTPGLGVAIGNLQEEYWAQHYYGALRVRR